MLGGRGLTPWDNVTHGSAKEIMPSASVLNPTELDYCMVYIPTVQLVDPVGIHRQGCLG